MLPHWLERLQRATLIATAFLFSAGYATVGLLVLLGTMITEGAIKRRFPWQKSAVDLPLLAFVLVFLISGWVSEFRAVAVASVGVAALTLYLGIGPLYRILQRDREFLKPFLLVWWAGGVLSAIWAIALRRQTGNAAFLPALGQNAVGTTLMIAMIIGLGLFLAFPGRLKYLIGTGSIVLVVGLAMTYTRGAWIGVGVGLIGFFTLIGMRPAWRAVLLVLLVALVSILLIGGPERSILLRRAFSITNPGLHTSRIFLAKTARAIFRDHPVLGTGLNSFPLVRANYIFPGDPSPASEHPNAHNMFLNMAAEGGILGLFAFLALIFSSLAAGWRWYRRSQATERVLSATAVSAFLAIMTHQLFDATAFSVHLGSGMWFIAAILLAFGAGRPSLPASSSNG